MVGGDGERVGEHRGRSRKLATGSFGREENRRGELRGGLGGAALMVAGDSSGRHVELGLVLGAGRREG